MKKLFLDIFDEIYSLKQPIKENRRIARMIVALESPTASDYVLVLNNYNV